MERSMTNFKSLTLVAAIAAASQSYALEALDDASLSEMTGQAGVTIEIDTKITLDEFTYTDTDTGGSAFIGNVVIGGASVATSSAEAWNEGDRRDDGKIEIDVSAEGDLVIHFGAQNYQGVLEGTDYKDFGMTVGAIGVRGTNGQSTLMSDIRIAGVSGPADLIVYNDGDKGLIQAHGYFEVKDGGANIDVAGVGISDLKIGQDENPFAEATYEVDGVTYNKIVDYSGDAAIGNGDDNWAYSAATIQTVDVLDVNTSAVLVSDALSLKIDYYNSDISMNVGIGNGSSSNVGHIAMENFNVSGTELVVYGH